MAPLRALGFGPAKLSLSGSVSVAVERLRGAVVEAMVPDTTADGPNHAVFLCFSFLRATPRSAIVKKRLKYPQTSPMRL